MLKTEALSIIFDGIPADAPALCTTGMISRESFTIRDRETNFYLIGSMGYASSVGIGIALCRPGRPVFVIDGDGSALMNLGSLPLAGYLELDNFYHIVLDNETYSSTGGQPTLSSKIALEEIALSAGYKDAYKFTELPDLQSRFPDIVTACGPVFILIKVEAGNLAGISRVTHSPEEIRDRFKSRIQDG